MAMKGKGAEIRAGIVVVGGLLILALGMFLVSGGPDQFRDKKYFTVFFRNAGGLGNGNAVYLAGRRVGKVVDVSTAELVREGKTRTYVLIRIEINKDSIVHTDSVFIVSKTVTGIVALNVEYGTGDEATEKTELFGAKSATFEEAIHHADLLLVQAGEIVDGINEAVGKVNLILDEVTEGKVAQDLDIAMENLKEAAAGVNVVVADVRKALPGILDPIQSGAKNLDTITGDLVKDWDESLQPRLQTVLDTANRVVEEAEAMLKDNREGLRSAVQSLEDGARRIGPVLAVVEKLGQNLSGTVLEMRPNLIAALRSARVGFDNFEGLTEDLKTAPWKLINEPSGDEVREVYLYNAARTYIASAARIQQIVDEMETMRRLTAQGQQPGEEAVQSLLTRLKQSLKEYDDHEKDLVRLIVENGNGDKGK